MNKKLLVIVMVLFSSILRSSPSNESISRKYQRIVILTLAADNNFFTNPIVNSAVYHLNTTDHKFDFNILPFSENPIKMKNRTYLDMYVKNIKTFDPDLILIADDKLYTLLFSKLKDIGAHITTFFSNLERHEIYHGEQSGLFSDYPAKEIIQYSRKLKKIKRVAILGNPWSKRNGDTIVRKIKDDVHVDYFEADRWIDWKKKLKEIEKKYDIVWLFLPYGVEDETGSQVDFNRAIAEIKSLKIPTIGFGQSKRVKRTITVGMVLDSIGRNLASMINKYLSDRKSVINSYRSFDIALNYRDCKRLGINIPLDLIQHVEI